MPREPIYSRQYFVERRNLTGTLRTMDFALVNTSLGACIEPRSLNLWNTPVADSASNADVLEEDSYNGTTVVERGEIPEWMQMNNGFQIPRYW